MRTVHTVLAGQFTFLRGITDGGSTLFFCKATYTLPILISLDFKAVAAFAYSGARRLPTEHVSQETAMHAYSAAHPMGEPHSQQNASQNRVTYPTPLRSTSQ